MGAGKSIIVCAVWKDFNSIFIKIQGLPEKACGTAIEQPMGHQFAIFVLIWNLTFKDNTDTPAV